MRELVNWVNINSDIENHVKTCITCLEFQQTQPKEKIIHCEILLRPWEVLGVDTFQLNNKNYLCIVDYHSKFPVIKRMEGLSAENLIATTNVIFAEYGILHRLMSDASSNFVSETFRSFCSSLNIKHIVSSLYHHQRNGQVEICIKFIQCTIKNAQTPLVTYTWHYYKSEPHHWGKVSPSLAALLFNHLVCSIMPVVDKKPVSVDNDDEHHKKLLHRQGKNAMKNDASQVFVSIPIGSTVVVQWEDGGLWTHGMIVGKGHYNHNNWSYKIQATTTGRIITCNRQHIKPTSVTAEDYMCYQARKHINIQTNPLDTILDCIKKKPQSYSKTTHNNNNNSQDTHGEHGDKNNSQGSGQGQTVKNI